jgi:enoyl-CoA hydratase
MKLMNDANLIYLEKNKSIATMFFNRPEKRNALTFEMWENIFNLLKEAEEDNQIKVLVIRSVDEIAFSAGADISEFKRLRSSAEGTESYNKVISEAERVLAQLCKPTISMIQGYCVGGGCELSVACDFRFSDTTGKFAITPAKLGFVYNFSGTKQLVDLIGPSKAKDILFSGRILDAEEALQIGLIDRIYLPGEIVEKTYDYANLLARNSQVTIQGVKKVVGEILNGNTSQDEETAKMILSSYQSNDYKEGVQAFNEKRQPNFLGI